MADIVIVANVFGAAQVHEQGYHAYIPLTASVGTVGFEVRCELLSAGLDGTVLTNLLATLDHLMTVYDLWAVYPMPTTLYTDISALDTVTVRSTLVEAQTLGTRIVEFQLGGFADGTSAGLLVRLLQGQRARVLVESDQQAVGGPLSRFQGLFGVLEMVGVADILGMAFGVGNWEWAGETPLTYAQALTPYIEYIHCRSVAGEGARHLAVAPASNSARFAAMLAALPGDVPRGIEFPFDVVNPAAGAHQHVMWLKAA